VERNGDARSSAMLLVNIEGENTISEYAEASAELALEIRGQRQELELKNGLIWRRQGEEFDPDQAQARQRQLECGGVRRHKGRGGHL
jgi:hypothetical protein